MFTPAEDHLMGQEKCVRVIITGTVQGVGFRWRARQTALSLGLSGWIKNRLDGGVEAVFQGPPESVDQMIEWVRVGPPGAVVREVMYLHCDPDLGRSDFLILRST